MRWLLVMLASLVLCLAACSSDSKTAASAPVTVFAAASLTEPFNELPTPGLDVTYSFAGSGALVTQVQQGAPADVIATADTTSMQTLGDAGLVETPTTFAKNTLEILVAPGNPLGIKTLADLARIDIIYITEDESVPAGKYAAQILATAHVTADA